MESNGIRRKLFQNKILHATSNHLKENLMINESIITSANNHQDISIFMNELSEIEILKEICNERESEEPFNVLDVADVMRKYLIWQQKMPRITPHYAVKCNPDPTVIKVLAALGGHFDCASKQEIEQIVSCGVSGDRIIFAHPVKFVSHLKYAKKVGVSTMTVDSMEELAKIKMIYPSAKIIIRIKCDANGSEVTLGKKFGCNPENEAITLIKYTIELGLSLYGFSFHAGSPCGEIAAICRGIKLCHNLIKIALSMGCHHAKIIDIGGGFPGDRNRSLDEFADAINEELDNVDPSIEIISEPGRYFVTSAFTAVACVVGKKLNVINAKKTFMYFLSDGKYGSFSEIVTNIKTKVPTILNDVESRSEEKYLSTIWGPTCHPGDYVRTNEFLPEYNIGDWLAWFDIGCYSICFAKDFNGFETPKVYPVINERDWNTLCNEISKKSWKKY